MRRRTFLALLMACLVGGCAGAVHQLPQTSAANLAAAQMDVQGAPPLLRHAVTDEDARMALQSAIQRILGAAKEVCREIDIGTCYWRFELVRDRSLNAGAAPGGLVIVNRGTVEYVENEEELCLVIAHEIGHQAANHPLRGMRNRTAGGFIGAVVLGAIGALASSGSHNSTEVIASAARTGYNIGAYVGDLSFSKEQEREADYLAAMILYRAGVDLDKARGVMVKMARLSGDRETDPLDTHPVGPDRLAGWDSAVQQIRASDGRLPPRKS